MSRKNKNLRAFLHQNPEPTIEQAWDAAWHVAQKTFHARSMQEIRGQVDRLRGIAKRIVADYEHWQNDEPGPDDIGDIVADARALLMELKNLEHFE